MERKIGEIFEYKGEWYQCIRSILTCSICEIPRPCSKIRELGYCSSNMRNDKEQVVFKKLEKVGKPFYRRWTLEGNNKLMQRYKIYTTPLITIDKQKMFYDLTDNLLEIEIKQNKEDMEEKNWTLDDAIKHYDEIGKSSISQECSKKNHQVRDWLVELKQYKKHSNSEKIRKDLKPFDLQKAREGKPVCTRDGRKARIICFDAKGNMPIIALIDNGTHEDLYRYYDSGSNHVDNDYDLMMLPEKKEGWVNMYKSATWPTKEEAVKYRNKCNDYIDTIKITWEE